MFKPREHAEYGVGQTEGGKASAAAALSHAQVVPQEALPEPAPAGFSALLQQLHERLSALKTEIETRCNTIELAPDLAEDIGSARWFRGLGTMLGLSLAAISFWPDFSALEAATAMPIGTAERDEFRSQMIMPLALGADSGRHMGATAAVVPFAGTPERPTVRLTATLGRGDSFGRMLQRAGIGAGDASQVSEMVAAALPLDEIGSGTRFDITLGRRSGPGQPRPLDKLAFRARFDLELSIERAGGALALARHRIAVDSTPLRIRGQVGSSLYRSARAAGAPLKAIQEYLQTVDQHLSLESDIGSSDQFDIIVAYKRSAKGETETGQLLYAGLERAGRPRLQLLRWGPDGQFYEASGIGRQRSNRFAPVAGRMTSRFGMRRHPILGYVRMHSGIDFAARYGSPIFAVSDGVATYSGRHGGHGKYVRLEHGGGIGTGYAHMSQIAVSAGTHVRAGQVIGYVGSTGLSTGPHLHFEVYRNGRKIDPMSVSFTVRNEVNKNELMAFKARLADLRAIAPGEALGSIAPRKAEVKMPVREIDRLEN